MGTKDDDKRSTNARMWLVLTPKARRLMAVMEPPRVLLDLDAQVRALAASGALPVASVDRSIGRWAVFRDSPDRGDHAAPSGAVPALADRVAALVKARGSMTSAQIDSELAARATALDDLRRARKLAEKRGEIVRGAPNGRGFMWHTVKGDQCAATANDAGAGLTLRCVLTDPHPDLPHTCEGMQWRDGEEPRGFMACSAGIRMLKEGGEA